MAFDKQMPGEVSEYRILDVGSQDELVKEASDMSIFPDNFTYDPDFLYLWVRIVSSGEYFGPNKNGDYFPSEELRKSFESFWNAHPFKNHENKQIEKAIGRIFDVRWNEAMQCVEVLKGIDKKTAPEIARGYLKGYLTDVSMGCKVPYTVCSICGNKARRPSEFCDHVKHNRLRMLKNGERVYEINYEPKFHDSSTVLNGAERVAKAFMVIDEPMDNVVAPSFRKAASTSNGDTYVRMSGQEMDKVASVMQELHPLLKDPTNGLEKRASNRPMLQKIAELEKELTGKLLNVVSSGQTASSSEEQMLEVIKFLTEKRIDTDSMETMASSIKALAKEHDIPVPKAFSTFLGIAELMGIEFFPNELHVMLRHLSDAELSATTESQELLDGARVGPSDYTERMNSHLPAYNRMESLESPDDLYNFYNSSSYHPEMFEQNPVAFMEHFPRASDVDTEPPVRVIKVMRGMLEPHKQLRSSHPEHLYPRLALVLNGHRDLEGDEEVNRDLNMLFQPETSGDVLGALSYSSYENMRPALMGTKIVKTAAPFIDVDTWEKTAAGIGDAASYNPGKNPKGGISRRKLALGAIPAAFAASAFQKSRRDNNRHLSDGENFVADHPGIIAGGAVIGGKPLSRAVQKHGKALKHSAGKGADQVKDMFSKSSGWNDEWMDGLVKTADPLPSGAYNIFTDSPVMERYVQQTHADPEVAAAVKTALVLEYGGMDKEAQELREHYEIPDTETDRLLRLACDCVNDDMEKAAGEFTNNMVLGAIGDSTPMGRSLPGRALDAFIFKKLSEGGEPEDKKDANVGMSAAKSVKNYADDARSATTTT